MQQDTPNPAHRRKLKNYLLDMSLQLPIVLGLVGLLSVVTLLFAFVLSAMATPETYSGMTGEDIKTLTMRLNAAYFAVSAAATIVFLTIVTHRIAGPAMVIREAIRGMVEGDHSRRTSLRSGDFLTDVAEAATQLKSSLADREAQRRQFLEGVAGHLSAGETDEALALVNEALGQPAETSEPAPTAAR